MSDAEKSTEQTLTKEPTQTLEEVEQATKTLFEEIKLTLDMATIEYTYVYPMTFIMTRNEKNLARWPAASTITGVNGGGDICIKGASFTWTQQEDGVSIWLSGTRWLMCCDKNDSRDLNLRWYEGEGYQAWCQAWADTPMLNNNPTSAYLTKLFNDEG